MDYHKIEQQDKPETAQPTDKNDGKVKAAKLEPEKEPTDSEPEVVQSEPKKSLLARFVDLFVGSTGVKAAAEQVVRETVTPSLKSLGLDFLESTLETWAMAHGTPIDRKRGRYISGVAPQVNSGQTPYNGMYNRQIANKTPEFKLATSSPSRFRQFTKPAYLDIEDCNEFFEALARYKQEKGYISVHDFFSAACWEEDARPTDKNWGWYSLRSFTKRKDLTTGYWVIEVLEEPQQI